MATDIGRTVYAASVPAAAAPLPGSKPERAVAEEAEQKQQSAKLAVPKLTSEKKLDDVVKEVAQMVRRDLSFSIDDDSGRTVVKVVDAASNEVVRQIPSEEMLALARRLADLTEAQQVSGEEAKGLLMTTRV